MTVLIELRHYCLQMYCTCSYWQASRNHWPALAYCLYLPCFSTRTWPPPHSKNGPETSTQSVSLCPSPSMQESILSHVQRIVKGEVSLAMKEQQAVVTSSIMQAMRSAAGTPIPSTHLDYQTQQANILQLLQQGQINQAFQQVSTRTHMHDILKLKTSLNVVQTWADVCFFFSNLKASMHWWGKRFIRRCLHLWCPVLFCLLSKNFFPLLYVVGWFCMEILNNSRYQKTLIIEFELLNVDTG